MSIPQKGTVPAPSHQLSSCPFCGCIPVFSKAESEDDNRFMTMTLSCCLTMSTSISYSQFRTMSEPEINAELRRELTQSWETRAEPDDEQIGVILYNGGDPVETGVYACRVPSDRMPGLHDDKFLMWFEGRWSYPGSDQNYRGDVDGWIGPLQRRMKPRTNN